VLAVGFPPLRESFRRGTYVSEALFPGVSIEKMVITSMLDFIAYFVLVIWIGITLFSFFHPSSQRRPPAQKMVVKSFHEKAGENLVVAGEERRSDEKTSVPT
jgi:phosphoribosyl 1,2-cyclic phosphodiesterase